MWNQLRRLRTVYTLWNLLRKQRSWFNSEQVLCKKCLQWNFTYLLGNFIIYIENWRGDSKVFRSKHFNIHTYICSKHEIKQGHKKSYIITPSNHCYKQNASNAIMERINDAYTVLALFFMGWYFHKFHEKSSHLWKYNRE